MTVQKRRGQKAPRGASFFRPGVIGAGALACILVMAPLTATTATAAVGDTISGIAWQDYSGDGKKETTDPVLAGIQIKAVDDAGNETASVTTAADGSYTLTLPSAAQKWRVVATIPNTPEWEQWREGYIGPDNDSTVQFVDAGATGVDFSFQVPSYFVERNPFVYSPIQRYGALNGGNGSKNAGAVVPWDAQTDPRAGVETPQKNVNEYNASLWQVPFSNIGSTNGSAWLRSDTQNGVGRLFVGSYLKSLVALGPNGIGAVYEITPDDGTKTSPTASGKLLVDLAAVGIDVGESGRADEATWTDEDYFNDGTARVPYVGRNGLGGMTLSNDGNTLYTVNLKNRSLIAIDISGGAVTADDVTEIEWDQYFPDGSDLRPFGLTTDPTTNEILLTVTKTAETSGDASQTGVQVYRFADATPQSLNLVMDENIGTLNQNQPYDSLVRTPSPWVQSANGFQYNSTLAPNVVSTNQYIASDIELIRGELILGFRNLTGDQVGGGTPITSNGQTRNSSKTTLGITVAAVPGADGTFSIPDWNNYDDTWAVGGQRISGQGQGSLVAIQSRPDGILTSGVHVGAGGGETGLRRIDVTTDTYVGVTGPVLNQQRGVALGKANGLGSLSALAGNAPIEIGNRVWLDLDNDGTQDPSEVPLAGVTVRLLASDGSVVKTKTTDANGVYVFRSDTDGVQPNTDYTVEFDKSTTTLTPALTALGVSDVALLQLTTQTAGGDRLIDSNPDASNGRAPVTTKTSGENDHSIDAGYIILPLVGVDKKVLLAGEPVDGAPAESDTLYVNGVAQPRQVKPGDTIRYALTARAANPGALAQDVTVKDALPSGLQMSGYATTLNGAAATQTYTNGVWTIGDMKPGDVAQLVITAKVGSLTPQNQQVTNVAQLTIDGKDVPDVKENNPGRDGGRNTDPSDGYDEADIIVAEPDDPGNPSSSNPGTSVTNPSTTTTNPSTTTTNPSTTTTNPSTTTTNPSTTTTNPSTTTTNPSTTTTNPSTTTTNPSTTTTNPSTTTTNPSTTTTNPSTTTTNPSTTTTNPSTTTTNPSTTTTNPSTTTTNPSTTTTNPSTTTTNPSTTTTNPSTTTTNPSTTTTNPSTTTTNPSTTTTNPSTTTTNPSTTTTNPSTTTTNPSTTTTNPSTTTTNPSTTTTNPSTTTTNPSTTTTNPSTTTTNPSTTTTNPSTTTTNPSTTTTNPSTTTTNPSTTTTNPSTTTTNPSTTTTNPSTTTTNPSTTTTNPSTTTTNPSTTTTNPSTTTTNPSTTTTNPSTTTTNPSTTTTNPSTTTTNPSTTTTNPSTTTTNPSTTTTNPSTTTTNPSTTTTNPSTTTTNPSTTTTNPSTTTTNPSTTTTNPSTTTTNPSTTTTNPSTTTTNPSTTTTNPSTTTTNPSTTTTNPSTTTTNPSTTTTNPSTTTTNPSTTTTNPSTTTTNPSTTTTNPSTTTTNPSTTTTNPSTTTTNPSTTTTNPSTTTTNPSTTTTNPSTTTTNPSTTTTNPSTTTTNPSTTTTNPSTTTTNPSTTTTNPSTTTTNPSTTTTNPSTTTTNPSTTTTNPSTTTTNPSTTTTNPSTTTTNPSTTTTNPSTTTTNPSTTTTNPSTTTTNPSTTTTNPSTTTTNPSTTTTNPSTTTTNPSTTTTNPSTTTTNPSTTTTNPSTTTTNPSTTTTNPSTTTTNPSTTTTNPSTTTTNPGTTTTNPGTTTTNPGTTTTNPGTSTTNPGTSTTNPAITLPGNSKPGTSGGGNADNLASTGAGDTTALTLGGLLAVAAGAVFGFFGWRRRSSRSSLEG